MSKTGVFFMPYDLLDMVCKRIMDEPTTIHQKQINLEHDINKTVIPQARCHICSVVPDTKVTAEYCNPENEIKLVLDFTCPKCHHRAAVGDYLTLPKN